MVKYINKYTLVELMIVVVIISISLAMFVGGWSGATDEANARQTALQLEGLQSAIRTYKLSKGSYPTNKADLLPFIKSKELGVGIDWTGNTPIGGTWGYEVESVSGYKSAYVILEDVTAPEEILELLDRLVDISPGLSSGNFYKHNGNYEMVAGGSKR